MEFLRLRFRIFPVGREAIHSTNSGLFSQFFGDINAKSACTKYTETVWQSVLTYRFGTFEAVGKIIQAIIFSLAHFLKAGFIAFKTAGAVH